MPWWNGEWYEALLWVAVAILFGTWFGYQLATYLSRGARSMIEAGEVFIHSAVR